MVGEALGEHEYRAGLPFRPEARAGSILERAIKRSGYAREEFGITDVVRCQPPDSVLHRAPCEAGAVAHCRPNLDQVVHELRPKVILALGDVALRALTGHGRRAPHRTHAAGLRAGECTLPGRAGGTRLPPALSRARRQVPRPGDGRQDRRRGGQGWHALVRRDVLRHQEGGGSRPNTGIAFEPPRYIERPTPGAGTRIPATGPRQPEPHRHLRHRNPRLGRQGRGVPGDRRAGDLPDSVLASHPVPGSVSPGTASSSP